MTIYTDGLRDSGPLSIDELPASGAEVLSQSASDAFMGGTRSLYGIAELGAAKGNVATVPDEFGGMQVVGDKQTPDVPMDEARQRVKSEGLNINLPDEPAIKKPALDIMINRAHEERERQAVYARGPQNLGMSALSFGTSFAVGMFDPLNVAAAFIPVVGELRYAKMLEAAGESVIARTGVRAAVGGLQGAVGTAALQPLEYYARTQEGQDYTFTQALESVLMGAGFGAAAHNLFGAPGGVPSVFADLRHGPTMDVGGVHIPIKWLKEVEPGALEPEELEAPAAPESPGSPEDIARAMRAITPAETLADLPPKAKEDVARVGISQLVEGKPVSVGEVLEEAAKTDPRIAESVNAGRQKNPYQTADVVARIGRGDLDVPSVDELSTLISSSREADRVHAGLDEKTYARLEYLNRQIDRGSDAAIAEKNRILSRAPKDRGEPDIPDVDELRQLRGEYESLEKQGHETPAEYADGVARVLKRHIGRFIEGDPFARAVFRKAFEEARRHGMDTRALGNEVINRFLSDLSPSDQSFMRAEFAKFTAPRIEPSAPVPTKGPRARDPSTYSLNEFLASRGGLQPHPDLATIYGGKNPFVPGFGRLLRGEGLTLDRAREAAVEAGYLSDEASGQQRPTESTINDLLTSLDTEARGQRQYRTGSEPRDKQARADYRVELERHFDDEMHAAGLDSSSVTGALRRRVIEIMEKEGVSDPLSAYERAVLEEDRNAVEQGSAPPLEPLEGWDIDDAAAASRAGDGAPSEGRAGPRAAGAAARERGADDGRARFRELADREPEPELADASIAADHELEPASIDPEKSVSAAEKALADAEAEWAAMRDMLPEDEREAFTNLLNEIDRHSEERAQMIKLGAACLAQATV